MLYIVSSLLVTSFSLVAARPRAMVMRQVVALPSGADLRPQIRARLVAAVYNRRTRAVAAVYDRRTRPVAAVYDRRIRAVAAVYDRRIVRISFASVGGHRPPLQLYRQEPQSRAIPRRKEPPFQAALSLWEVSP